MAAIFTALIVGVLIGRTEASEIKFTVEPGHPRTPPFGLERVGRPLEAVVEVPGTLALAAEFAVVDYRDGVVTRRRTIELLKGELQSAIAKSDPESRFGRIALDEWPDEVALFERSSPQAEWFEIARMEVKPPQFEADAAARAEIPVNPVDLGAILPPEKWLVIGGRQKAIVKLAALSRTQDPGVARVNAWFASSSDQKVAADLRLDRNRRAEASVELGPCSSTLDRDTLHVVIEDGEGGILWRKEIETMIVPEPPDWPEFGAIATKLRFDEPLTRGDGPSPPYNESWDPELQDIVVFFPNGARWVFWRGFQYCPFWAGRSNTGLSYQWAERAPASDGIGWSEPCFDNELRYGRVEIVSSSPSRVHVRWRYQTSDPDYRATGDSVTEDFVFYPDGFGTRTVTLIRDPEWKYQFEELILMLPSGRFLPKSLLQAPIEVTSLQRERVLVSLPVRGSNPKNILDKLEDWPGDGETPALYRVRLHQEEPLSAVGFSLTNNGRPRAVAPVYDRGAMFPPYGILLSWPGTLDGMWFDEPFSQTPFRSESIELKDDDGGSRKRVVDTYVWLIGMSDEDDDRLIERAAGFATPPNLEVTGATMVGDTFVPERRAFRMIVEKPTVGIRIGSGVSCVNPVFELSSASEILEAVQIDGVPLDPARYAWDGATLWLDLTLSQSSELRLEFATDRS